MTPVTKLGSDLLQQKCISSRLMSFEWKWEIKILTSFRKDHETKPSSSISQSAF